MQIKTLALALLLSPAVTAQGAATNFGSGCGAGLLAYQGSAAPGEVFTITANGTQPTDVVLLLIGFSDTTSLYGPLPLALPQPPWLPGCELLTSAGLLLPMPGGSVPGALPAQLDNYHIYLQAFVRDSAGVNTMTQGIDLFVLAPVTATGDVDGTVRFSAGGLPADGARVTLFTADLSSFFELRSAASGAFSFKGVPVGTYQLGVALRGRQYEERSVVLGSAGLTENFSLVAEGEPGTWTVAGSTAPQILDATDIAILRPDGTVFFCHDTTDSILFDPVAGQSSFPPGSGSAQGCMNGTLLQDGSILLAGGQDGSSPAQFQNAVPWVKKFKPDGTWQNLPDMLAPSGRWYPGLTRLADGRLLLFGGGTAPSAVRTDTAEIFDPVTETWSWTGSMGSVNEFAPSVLLEDGRVLRTWGAAPEVYDPATGVWAPTGAFAAPNRGYPGHSDHSLLQLSDGRALVLGINSFFQPGASMTEYFDPGTSTWSAGTSPDLRRMQGEVVYLPDGRVLFGGGDIQSQTTAEPDLLGIVRRCDLLDPVSGVWRQVADMLTFREYHGVTLLLPDARVLTTGGTVIKFQTGPTTSDIEAWSPPYLSRGVRPVISNPSSTAPARGDLLSVGVFPATALTSLVLMGMQTHTHWMEGGIPRRIELAVTQTGSQASVPLPTDPNELPVGWYMLFGMVDDIPSEAIVLRVDP